MSDHDSGAEWVLRVLGVDVSGVTASTEDNGDSDASRYRGLLETVQEDLRTLTGIDKTVVLSITTLVETAGREADRTEWSAAVAWLERAAEEIARAKAKARMNEVSETVPEGIVSEMVLRFETARNQWNAALSDARAASAGYTARLSEEYPREATGYGTILESYWSDLSGLLAAAKANEDAEKILETANSLRKEFEADDLFDDLEAEGVAARLPFLAAIDQIENLLQS